MANNDLHSISFSFKLLLLAIAAVFAVAVIILIMSATSAATPTGSAPAVAISLASELNTGILGPGEQRWFKFTPEGPASNGHIEEAFTMFFTPDDGTRIRHISLELYDESQLPYFYEGDSGEMANLGAGSVVSRDGNPETGEMLWAGWLTEQQSYYVQIENGSQTPIDYWLLMDDVVNYSLGQPTATAVPAAVVNDGTSPQTALPVTYRPQDLAPRTGNLEPGQEIWYSFSTADGDSEFFEEVALTMFATPNEGHQAQRLNFEVFTADAVQNWAVDNQTVHNTGAGSLVQRDNDPLTTEHFWTGWVVEGNIYYVRIHNGAEGPIDYWLYNGDIYNPALGAVQ